MWPFSQVREAVVFKLTKYASEAYRERIQHLENENWRVQEAYDQLHLDMENEGYAALTRLATVRMDRRRLGDIIQLATQMAIKNPIVNRTLNVQADYVFGRGVRFVAQDPKVQEWIDEFVNFDGNKKVLTGPTAMRKQERNLQTEGQRFFALYTNTRTGRVIVRCLATEDVADIIRDPEDYERCLYVRRTFESLNGGMVTVYHPCLGITKLSGVGSPQENVLSGMDAPPGEILWDAPVYIMQFNVYGRDKFAVPEVYPQLDWALAYKRFLEDWTSIIRSFARFALRITGMTGRKQMAAAKNMMQTTVSLDNPSEKNPSGTASRIPLMGKGLDIDAVKTAGATTPAKEGGPVLNMAAAAAGLPNHFFGDSSQGNYSTAKTLDRPTELKMIARILLWTEVFEAILGYVVETRAAKEYGVERTENVFTNEIQMVPKYPSKFNSKVRAVFPDILERNVTDRVRALVNAITLFGKPLTDIIPDKKLVARLLMEALDMPDIDAHLDTFMEMWEKNMNAEPGEPVEAGIIPPAPIQSGGAEDAAQGGDVGANG